VPIKAPFLRLYPRSDLAQVLASRSAASRTAGTAKPSGDFASGLASAEQAAAHSRRSIRPACSSTGVLI
jgi:hypothetical protein